jgi:hypothetical protein
MFFLLMYSDVDEIVLQTRYSRPNHNGSLTISARWIGSPLPSQPQAALFHSKSAVPIRERMRLSVWKKQVNHFAVCLVNNAALPEAAFAFGRFLGQNMIGMGFLVYQFSRAGFAKSFGC